MALENCLQELILRIYHMDLSKLSRLAVVVAMVFGWIYRKRCGRSWFRICVALGLAGWVGVVLWMTVLSRESGSVAQYSWIPLNTYWRVLCGESGEYLRSAYMNVLLFFPGGLLLAALMPEKWSFRRGMCCAIAGLMLLSLTIELIQYFRQLGTAELDDVLHNNLGAALGYAAFHLDFDDET